MKKRFSLQQLAKAEEKAHVQHQVNIRLTHQEFVHIQKIAVDECMTVRSFITRMVKAFIKETKG